MNYLISAVHTIRVPDVMAVEKLHSDLKNDNRFTLKKFEYQQKEIKEKGEIVEEYQLVKATLIFNNEKEPDTEVKINYDINDVFFKEDE